MQKRNVVAQYGVRVAKCAVCAETRDEMTRGDNCSRKCCIYCTLQVVMACVQNSLRIKSWGSQTQTQRRTLNLFSAQHTNDTSDETSGTLNTTPFRCCMLGRNVAQFARIYRRCGRTWRLHIQRSLKVETPGSSNTSAHLHRKASSGTGTIAGATAGV